MTTSAKSARQAPTHEDPPPGLRLLNGVGPQFVPVVFDAREAINPAFKRLRKYLWPKAIRLAKGDKEYARDLMEEARLKLWELDPSRFEDEDDDKYACRIIIDHMHDVARKEQSRVGEARHLRMPSSDHEPDAYRKATNQINLGDGAFLRVPPGYY